MSRPSVLYVIPAVGGTAPEFALPRLRERGDVHAVLFSTPTAAVEKMMREWCASVRWLSPDAAMPDTIVDVARQVAADAIVAFSESAIVGVAAACEQLGLRGPGPGVIRSRDKVAMRTLWQERGLPNPPFAAVRSQEDLERAAQVLRRPFLLKPSWLAGSLGHVIVDDSTDIAAAWRRAARAIEEVERAGVRDLMTIGRGPQLIAEEIIDATTDSWYDVPGYGDYVSVEGLVVGGRYHPVCITARLPTIPPFVELSFHIPTVLAEDRQRRIEETTRAAVDALGLGYCGTHTELKLQRDGGLCLLESAARLGGAMITRLVLEALQVDLIGLLVGALLGEEPELPDRMLTAGRPGLAVASLMLLATDSTGRPWRSLPAFRPDRVDWRRLTSPGTEVEIVWGQTRASGSPMPEFSPTGGTLNYAGTILLRAADPATLKSDCYRILDGLEAEMARA